jgi:hypothetical protein
MRRGVSLKSKLARLAVAYAIGLQGLLGAWGGFASAHSVERDASLSLCRTLAAGDIQPSDETAPVHCVVMCLGGACNTTAPPTPAIVTTEYAPRQIAVVLAKDQETVRPIAPIFAHSARGPPTVV